MGATKKKKKKSAKKGNTPKQPEEETIQGAQKTEDKKGSQTKNMKSPTQFTVSAVHIPRIKQGSVIRRGIWYVSTMLTQNHTLLRPVI